MPNCRLNHLDRFTKRQEAHHGVPYTYLGYHPVNNIPDSIQLPQDNRQVWIGEAIDGLLFQKQLSRSAPIGELGRIGNPHGTAEDGCTDFSLAKGARDEGFDEIADWFETLAKAERSHANRFQKALDALTD